MSAAILRGVAALLALTHPACAELLLALVDAGGDGEAALAVLGPGPRLALVESITRPLDVARAALVLRALLSGQDVAEGAERYIVTAERLPRGPLAARMLAQVALDAREYVDEELRAVLADYAARVGLAAVSRAEGTPAPGRAEQLGRVVVADGDGVAYSDRLRRAAGTGGAW